MHTIQHKTHKIILALLFIFLAPTMGISAPLTDPYKNIKYYELDNGLKVFMLSDKLVTNTQIDVEVNIGMDIENEDDAGISHLLEHIIFRDQRVPHNDYLDYIKEEGATDVNGYTSRYNTHYIATIDANKSYWLVETFAQMLLDKVVTDEDLEIEKKALQVEIGELHWYNKIAYIFAKVFKQFSNLFPDTQNIYTDEFSLKKITPLPSSYFYKKNNKNFTLAAVMKHYDDYYYPKNMTLKIVGNFDDVKMKELITKLFGASKKVGTKRVVEPAYNAKLNAKAHLSYITGEEENYAYLGTKYILDDYKKYLIVDTYTEYLATNMQQLLRNKLGQTYSVSSFYNSDRDAIITGVNFGSLHVGFHHNIELVKQKIKQDTKEMKISEIEEAIKQSALYYSSLEHTSYTLLNLVDAQEYIQTYHSIFDETPYSIFNSITPQDFQTTITQVYAPQNHYTYIYNDYYLFPFDMSILLILMLFILIYVYIKAHKLFYVKKGLIAYNNRDLIFSRRLSNRFLLFLKFILIFTIAQFISSWSEYWLLLTLFDNPYYAEVIEPPYDYLYHIISFTYFLIIVILLLNTIFKKSFSRLDVTKNGLYFIGSSVGFIAKDELSQISIVPWSLKKSNTTFGLAVLFFKPLLMLSLKDGSYLYLRSNNAEHLKEDLQEWLNKD